MSGCLCSHKTTLPFIRESAGLWYRIETMAAWGEDNKEDEDSETDSESEEEENDTSSSEEEEEVDTTSMSDLT